MRTFGSCSWKMKARFHLKKKSIRYTELNRLRIEQYPRAFYIITIEINTILYKYIIHSRILYYISYLSIYQQT